ncbi:hypothetical protein ACFY05_32125 [Microtetraspora fusca]|uniref:Siphovirus-type tail component C-terminal domain-containing protein n=1 Tax=Microtetraspora fusca TaxID=1997 RepID=A0ABW6VDU3_MICFU
MSTQTATPLYRLGTWEGNVTDAWGVDWIVEAEDGWSSSPPVRALTEPRNSTDGAWGGPGLYGPRVVTLSGRAVAPDRLTMLAAKDRIKAAVNPRTLVQLVVAEDHLTRVANVRMSDQVALTDEGSFAFRWALTVVAADPRRYAATPMSGTTTLPASLTAGRTYSRTYSVTYGAGAGGSTGSVYIQQDGDYDQTPAVIVITGPVINPQVEHVASGRELAFDLTLAYDETLTIDLKTQVALLNGAANQAYRITATSAWWMLAPGSNEIAFRGTPGTPPPDITPTPIPQMTVTASSAWS